MEVKKSSSIKKTYLVHSLVTLMQLGQPEMWLNSVYTVWWEVDLMRVYLVTSCRSHESLSCDTESSLVVTIN